MTSGKRLSNGAESSSSAHRSAFIVTALADEHIAGFRDAVDSVAREQRYLAMLEAPPLEDCRAYVLDMRRRGFPQYAAFSGNRLVGWCDISPVDRPVHAHCGTLGIGVIDGYRGRGLGSSLLDATLRRAREIGITRVELGVREHNAPAIALYEKFGFMNEGVRRNAVRVAGDYEHVIAMALLF